MPPTPLQWNDELITRFWDYESQYLEHYFTYKFGGQIVTRVWPYLRRCKSILDYGCGTGDITPHLLALGAKVTGADVSPKSLNVVNAKFHGHPQFQGAFGLNHLLESKRTFHAVIVAEVIEHLNDHELEATVNNVRQLLSPGGVAIFTTPHDEDLAASHIYCPSCEHTFHRWQHVRSWTPNSITRYMESHGLHVLRASPVDFSLSFRNNKLGFLLHLQAKLRRRKIKMPHLLCVCSLAEY